MTYCTVAGDPIPLVTLTVNVNVPRLVGVPEITPVTGLSDIPGGRLPADILHVIAEGYPKAVMVWLYGVLIEPFGGEPDVIDGASGSLISILSVAVSEPADGVPPCVAVTVTKNILDCVGVPDMTPAALMVRPGGRPVAVHVIGAVPVAAILNGVYGTVLMPSGRDAVVIVGADGPVILMVNVASDEPPGFVARTLNVYELFDAATVGVPESTPVVALRLSPGGRTPEPVSVTTDQFVTGGVVFAVTN
jgi:hypothetical protein